MVDLQLMRYGPPSCDLWYVLTSATNLDWRKEHLGELLAYYHGHLSSTLSTLGYDPHRVFPFETFKRQFDACYGVGFVCGNFLVCVSDKKTHCCCRLY